MRFSLKYLSVGVFAACAMWSCITPYEPPVSESGTGLLVVDGIISDGETKIMLGRSASFSTPLGGAPVRNAKMWVESEDGDRFDVRPQTAAEADDGEYVVPVGELRPETRYRLRITTGGEQYESTWRPVQRTPEIERMDVYNNTEKGVMQVRVGLRGDEDRPRYYSWEYRETWESHALAGEPSYTPPDGSPSVANTSYYCWHIDSSKGMFLGSTDAMTENTIIDHVLYEFGYSDFRLFYLYHARVAQQSLAEDAYIYLESQKKNAEEMGSIFAPVPSEMKGNLVCTTRPNFPVIGFIEVSARQEKEYYLFTDGKSPYVMPPGSNFEGPHLRDCRVVWPNGMGGGGTKNKPAWWPNDHE